MLARVSRVPLVRSALQLGNKNVNLTRVSAARSLSTYDRTKPHLNVGTIGHVDHGKVCNYAIKIAVTIFHEDP